MIIFGPFFLFDVDLLVAFSLLFFLLSLFPGCSYDLLFCVGLFNETVVEDFPIKETILNLDEFHCEARSKLNQSNG
jgi:hypothetical protein